MAGRLGELPRWASISSGRQGNGLGRQYTGPDLHDSQARPLRKSILEPHVFRMTLRCAESWTDRG